LGYLLTLKGAEKLLAGEPLGRLVPVDEYLPIMYDRHPELRWAEAFPTRNLKVRVILFDLGRSNVFLSLLHIGLNPADIVD
jgi:hypothetical protein